MDKNKKGILFVTIAAFFICILIPLLIFSKSLSLFSLTKISGPKNDKSQEGNQNKEASLSPFLLQEDAYLPGEILVKFKKEVSDKLSKEGKKVLKSNKPLKTGNEKIDKLFRKYEVREVENIFLPGETSGDQAEKNKVKKVKVKKDHTMKALEEFRKEKEVEHAQLNFLYQIDGFHPNDELYNQQWAHENANAEAGWDIERGKNKVSIGIIDTGVDYNHEDLSENMWVNEKEIPGNGIDDDKNGFVDDYRGWDFSTCKQYGTNGCAEPKEEDADPLDDHGHGTHCAGIAAAKGNNSKGVAGVCMNCKIVPLKFLNSQGRGATSDAIKAINYSIKMSLDVISNSWGGGSYDQLLKDSIEEARNAGVFVVAAAGNGNTSTKTYPASYPYVFSVASIADDNQRAYYSNYGIFNVDIAAPGGDNTKECGGILSTVPKFVDPTGYKKFQGTSMACPYVSGLAGLLISEHNKISCEEIESAIRISAEPFGPDEKIYIGTGKVNVGKALAINVPSLEAKITDPKSGDLVNDKYEISGIAEGDSYVLQYGKGYYPCDNCWSEISTGKSVAGGVLGEFDPGQLDSGLYSLRLEVEDSRTKNFDQVFVTINKNKISKLLESENGEMAYSVSASGRNIVWAGYNESTFLSNIYLYDLGADEKINTSDDRGVFNVTNSTDIEYQQAYPHIHKDKIVWHKVTSTATESNVLMYDLGDDGIFGTADDLGQFEITTGNEIRAFPNIYGNNIVWLNYLSLLNPETLVQLFHLGNDGTYGTSDDGDTMIVSANPGFFTGMKYSTKENPKIYQNKIVWEDNTNGNPDIYLYDMGKDWVFGTSDDRGQLNITKHNKIFETQPSVYDGKISWMENFTIRNIYDLGQDNIFGSFDDRKIHVIGEGLRGTLGSLNFHGSNIAFDAYSGYSSCFDIHVSDLGGDGLIGTDDDSSYRLTYDLANKQNPVLSKNYVFWEDERSGQMEILLHEIIRKQRINGLRDLDFVQGETNNAYVTMETGMDLDWTFSLKLENGTDASAYGIEMRKIIVGDFDNDGDVDENDRQRFYAGFPAQKSFQLEQEHFDQLCNFDNDGDVDELDEELFLESLNLHASKGTGVYGVILNWQPNEAKLGKHDFVLTAKSPENQEYVDRFAITVKEGAQVDPVPNLINMHDIQAVEYEDVSTYLRAEDLDSNEFSYSYRTTNTVFYNPEDKMELSSIVIGDFDNDGDVDGSDLAFFSSSLGSTKNDPLSGYSPLCDFDNDSDVDGSDLAIFNKNFGTTGHNGAKAGLFSWKQGRYSKWANIIFTVTDPDGNSDSKTIDIFVEKDIEGPGTTVISPEENQAVPSSGFTVKGKYFDNSRKVAQVMYFLLDHGTGNFTADQESAELDESTNTWSFTVDQSMITAGSQAEIWIDAKDLAGNYNTSAFRSHRIFNVQ